MNNWSIVGIVCFCIAVILLVAGVGLGYEATSAVDQLGNFLGSYGSYYEGTLDEVRNALFIEKASPYLIGSAIMFIISFAGMFVGIKSSTKTSPESEIPVDKKEVPPSPKVAACPSCGQPMIFMAEHQRWYCPNEKTYI